MDNRREGSITDVLHRSESIYRYQDISSKVLTLQHINQCRINMISVYNKKRIINMYFVQGYGYKKICKHLHPRVGRKTIRRYCKDYAEALAKGSKEAVDCYLYKDVKYKVAIRPRTKLTPEIRQII